MFQYVLKVQLKLMFVYKVSNFLKQNISGQSMPIFCRMVLLSVVISSVNFYIL